MMKSHLRAFLAVFCISTVMTFSTIAQDNPYAERERLPIVTTNQNGEKCLNSEQWQQVLKVSSQNKGLFEWRLQIEPTIDMHARVMADYEQLIKNLELQIKVLKGDRTYLESRVTQMEKFATDLQKSNKLSVVGWKITAATGWAGVLALAITALAIN